MNWLYYLAEANLYLGVFYLCYYLFLKRETHYTLNRVFLLLSCVVSAILPLVQLDFLKTEPVYTNSIAYIEEPVTTFTWEDGLIYAYFTGVLILSVQFAFRLYQLYKLTRRTTTQLDGYKLIYLDDSDTAFSFFNYLFIGTQAPANDLITCHELVHIRQKHSADIVFLELFKIVNWFNPLVYLLQNSLKTLHEYIADERTASQDTDTIAYSTFLLNNAYGVTGSSITHSFYNYNLLKNRIMMLHQKRSGNLARLKYLLALPLCGAMLCQSTLGFSKTYGMIDIGTKKANSLAADTIKKNTKVKVTNLRSVPPPPPPMSAKNNEKVIIEVYDPRNPKPDVNKVKFPPRPPKEPRKVKVTNVKLLPPPPPPEPPVRKVKAKTAPKTAEVSIDEPVSSNAPVEIRLSEPVKDQPANEIRIEAAPKGDGKALKEVRIEQVKKGELSTFSVGTKN